MSKMTINAQDGRLTVMGYQPEVIRIYWSAWPTNMPVQGERFYYDGCEITAVYADGSEAVVTNYCTFSPASGSMVTEDTSVTVTATYTAKSGTAFQAEESMPITSLDHIKIILPHSYGVMKAKKIATSSYIIPNPSDFANIFGLSDIYIAAYWKKDDRIVRITDVPLSHADAGLSPGFSSFYGSSRETGPYVSSGVSDTDITFDRYTDYSEFSSVNYDYATALLARYKGCTDTAYFEADPFERYDSSSLPSSYSSGGRLIVYANDTNFLKLKYMKSGLQPLSLKYPYLNGGRPLDKPAFVAGDYASVDENDGLGNCVGFRYRNRTLGHKVTCIFANGKSGWFAIGRLTYISSGNRGYAFDETTTKFSYECNEGQITWTITNGE